MNWDWDKLQRQRKEGPGGGGVPPGFDELGEKLKRFKNLKFPLWKIVILAMVIIWLLSGIYIVAPEEIGVVKRFGEFHRIANPGPHYHIPYPIESVLKPDVAKVRRIEVGFRSMSQSGDFEQGQIRPITDESLMLTGDENIVDVQFIIQYRIEDAVAFLFNVDDPEATVKNAAEAAMREIIGKSEIDDALTTGKHEIQIQTQDLTQEILNLYKSGISIVSVQMQNVHPPNEVIDAFKDVASAREDRSKFVNQAKAYRNDILPRAEGQASIIVNDSQAYAESKVLKAQANAARFLAVLEEYNKAKDVTRMRLYLETMESILSDPDVQKVILSNDALRQSLPYLPLEQLPGKNPSRSGASQ